MIEIAFALLLQASPGSLTLGWAPSREFIQKFYPDTARKRGFEGRAVVQCTVNADRRPADCIVQEEDPEGQGFGEAALKLVPHFEAQHPTQAPVVGEMVRVPVNFRRPVDMKSGPILAPDARFAGQSVDVNCRYENLRFDGCYAMNASDPQAAEAAVALIQPLTMKRAYPPVGRILMPVRFVAPAAPAAR